MPDGEVDYGYLLDDSEQVLPDPRSRRQPRRRARALADVRPDRRSSGPTSTGPVVSWPVRSLYELHLGTFTPEGTLDAAIERLDHLVTLGVDLVELLPVNAFNGTHNWGYDGVLWSAVHEEYGGPAAYQRFVDAAHAAGLGVVQDVVYNHLGPSGNYLPLFGPYLKTEGENTWGSLVNLDGEGSAEVRRYILDSALTWLRDFHVDGLRLDAVHALADESDVHLLEELGVEVAALSAHLRRPLTLIAESDLNDALMVLPREVGGLGLDAQWSDDFHHALHVALTGETSGYYADFEPLSALAKVCERGFFHDGTYSSFRGRDHGSPVPTATMPTWRLVVCNQNHDQVGNRAAGDRLTERLDEDQLLCAALLTLAGPFTPMLFQGEEWAASAPFQFFTSHPEPELGHGHGRGTDARVRADGLGPRRWCPTRRTRRPSCAPGSTGPSSRPSRTPGCWRRTNASPSCAARCPSSPTRRSRRRRAPPTSVRRVFTMRRGDLLVAVNFGDEPAELLVEGDLDAAVPYAGPAHALRRPARTCPDMPGLCWVPRDHRGVTLSPGRRRRAAAGTAVALPAPWSACGADEDGRPGAGTLRRRPPLRRPLLRRRRPPARCRARAPATGPVIGATPAALAGQTGAAAQANGFGEIRPTPPELVAAAVHAARPAAAAAGHRLRLTGDHSGARRRHRAVDLEAGLPGRGRPTCPGCG